MSQTVGVSVPVPAPATQPSPAGRSWGRAVAVTFAVFVIAGLAAGWAWQRYAPVARYVVDESGGSMNEEEMTRVFGPDGLFVSIGFLTAVVLAAALFWWLRDNGPQAVAVVVLGSAAGSGTAWALGMLLGHEPLDPRLAAAKPGDLVAAPLELHGWSAVASWPVGAALAVAIIAALSWRQEHVTVEHDAPAQAGPVNPYAPGPYDAEATARLDAPGNVQPGQIQPGHVPPGQVRPGQAPSGGASAGQ
jgi:hypothetical protein